MANLIIVNLLALLIISSKNINYLALLIILLYKTDVPYDDVNILSLFSVGPAPFRSCVLYDIFNSTKKELSTLCVHVNCYRTVNSF